MTLPAIVVEHLQEAFVAETRPCCALVDETARLVDVLGDSAWCGLGDLQPGTDMLQAVPYLAGVLTGEAQRLDFVTTPAGAVMHLIVLPHERQHYVVFLDASREHAARQRRQQASNELRLLHVGQQRLIAKQRDLISELVEARAELDYHRREAERSSSSKSRFIAMMSHEFRTPLASIINYADLALEESASVTSTKKSIETIARSARHLTSLVEALLDDARLEAGQVELEEREFDLHALLGDIAAMMAPLAADKSLAFATQIDTDVPRFIRADDVRLRQILINLLGNAVKFTNEGGIQLAVTYHGGRLVATVADTGPGISGEDQEKVFRAFERGGSSQTEGAGLGLTITLRLAKLMGGEISLDSSPGRGCTVSVHVPVAQATAVIDRPESIFSVPTDDVLATRSASVLILDDDEDMLALLEHYLHRAGYGLITSSDGSEAIAKTFACDPDLVLLDVNLPGMSGMDIAQKLRRQGFAKPIVALTASKLSSEEKAKFTRCFRKPARMSDLLAEIRRLTHDAA